MKRKTFLYKILILENIAVKLFSLHCTMCGTLSRTKKKNKMSVQKKKKCFKENLQYTEQE